MDDREKYIMRHRKKYYRRTVAEVVADRLGIDGAGGWSLESSRIIAQYLTTRYLQNQIKNADNESFIPAYLQAIQEEYSERMLMGKERLRFPKIRRNKND